MNKLTNPNKSHPGRAGRKPAPFPAFLKKLRATDEERAEFGTFMTGNARHDFEMILSALRYRRNVLKKRLK